MRIRSTKPEFWQDEKMARELSRDARLLYKALWNESDDYGRLRGTESYLHGTLFPYDPGSWFADALQQLIDTGRALPYTADGGSYLHLTKFLKHQKIDKPTESRLPHPPDVSLLPREDLASASRAARPVASSGELVAVAGSGERGSTSCDPIGSPCSSPVEEEADRRTVGGRRKSEYLREVVALIEECYQREHGMASSSGDGIKSKVAGKLIETAKMDGFGVSQRANKAEIVRIAEAYFRDQDPFVADAKHPLTMLLGERLARYRRPMAKQPEVKASDG